MYILQLLHLKALRATTAQDSSIGTLEMKDQKQEILQEEKILNDNNNLKIKSQLKSTDQVKTSVVEGPKLKDEKLIKAKINNFEDIVKLANKENEIELKYDLERNVNLVSFRKGTIDISFNEKLNKNFIKILTEKLYNWTGERWIISLNKKIGEKTIYEKENESKINQINDAKNNKKIKLLLQTFDDASLIDIKKDEDK